MNPPPLKCVCDIPWIVNGKCVRCKRPIQPTTEPKSVEGEYKPLVEGATPISFKAIKDDFAKCSVVEGEWAEAFDGLWYEFIHGLGETGMNVDTMPDFIKSFITTLIRGEREKRNAEWSPSLSPRQEWRLHNGEVNVPEWFMRFCGRIRIAEREKVAKMCEEMMKEIPRRFDCPDCKELMKDLDRDDVRCAICNGERGFNSALASLRDKLSTL